MSDITQVEAIYLEAVGRTDPAERAAYLESACSGDAELRGRVEALLAAHSKVGQFLESPGDPTQGFHPETVPPTVAPGTIIAARFKLLERIGEGGMGEVWVAEQSAPIKRKVAVKLIKAGMDSRAVLARFEAERQALAVMDHPNIAKVLDGGLHEGRPFFVMELVKGVPITEFCDTRKLTPRERLELFVTVCQAIQHAHQKGVIHRDIKPSNVLVALYDDRAVPKVIDFGVAKAAGQTLTDMTLHTGFGTVVGTPEYMSPEQASFNNLDIDTRADVYSLGVLLYELLTGTTPVDRKSLKEAAVLEVLRIVREVDAPRPSLKLSATGTLASIAANRGTEPTKLPALLRGELDWIVLKALEKDRGRRYESANGLAADVARYLAGDTVSACPPTLAYRLKKVYRRYRAAVWVASAFVGLVIGAAIMGGVLAVQARQAEALAEAKRIEAEEEKMKAERLFATSSSLQEDYLEAAIEAEIRNNGSRLDADLLEYKSDPRVGLLRLARPLKDGIGPIKSDFPLPNSEHFMGFENDPEFVKLREFQAAAVISAGQDYVPLVQPLHLKAGADRVAEFDAPYEELRYERSPDRTWYAIHSFRAGVSLWALPEFSRVGLLREGDERVLRFGFTPDSRTAWTQDADSVVRFWNTDGTLRAKTPLRPDRFIYPSGMTHGQLINSTSYDSPNRLTVADGIAILQSRQVEWTWQKDDDGKLSRMSPKQGTVPREGPVELFSTRTGQFLRQLHKPGRRLGFDWRFSPDGRWMYAVENSDGDRGKQQSGVRQVVILSTEDGRELARLDHPGTESFLKVAVSPNCKWLLTYVNTPRGSSQVRSGSVLLWRCTDWQKVNDTTLDEAVGRLKSLIDPHFITDDMLALFTDNGILEGIYEGVLCLGKPGSWTRNTETAFFAADWVGLVAELGGSLIRCGRMLIDANTFQRLKPPPGRKYAAEFAKLTSDGRFWGSLDTVTERVLPYSALFEERNYVEEGLGVLFSPVNCEGRYFPGYGHVAVTRGNESFELRILPDPKRLDFPPEMLELWAQLVVGGELTPEGTFQPWNQPTWTAKQKELAAMKPPYADFPFPGWATQDPNLWWRIRANPNQHETIEQSDKYLAEWRRRSERAHPKPEPDIWRSPGPAPAQPKKVEDPKSPPK